MTDSKSVTPSARRINSLAHLMKATRYLEIGVCQGHTFLSVDIADKTGVDPMFLLDALAVSEANPAAKLVELTSDDYFSKLKDDPAFDIIFIDGLHTFEQTYRDLCNSLLYSHRQTVFLIDDVRPSDVYSSLPDQKMAVKRRSEAGGTSVLWHGDVYKVIFALHDFHPGLNYCTIVGSGNPQALVWRSNKGWRQPRFNSLERISRLTYFDLLDNFDLMRRLPEEEAIALCTSELLPQG